LISLVVDENSLMVEDTLGGLETESM